MSTVSDRLRERAGTWGDCPEDAALDLTAAEEIERLRAELTTSDEHRGKLVEIISEFLDADAIYNGGCSRAATRLYEEFARWSRSRTALEKAAGR